MELSQAELEKILLDYLEYLKQREKSQTNQKQVA